MSGNFSNNSRFPGTVTSPFDTLVRFLHLIDRVPTLLMFTVLFLLALIPARADLGIAFALWLFFIGDSGLLVFLPRTRKSFGPAKPTLLALALGRLIFAILPFPWNWIAQMVGTVLVVYGFWIEPHKIIVTRQSLASSKLTSALPPLRLLHLGDLHVERITARELQMIELARALKPDAILFSGDFLNLSYIHDPTAWDHTRTILRQLSAPLGVFVVTGSPPVDKPEVIEKLLDGLDHLRWLKNERVTVEHYGESIDIVGVTCSHKPPIDDAILDRVLQGDPDNFTVLLYHTPDLAPEAARRKIDLQLSGHTHGGQIRLPFFGALYTSSLYGKRFEAGRYAINDFTLYVTRGIGMEGEGAPRVRFLCPPEIILWEISGERQQTL